MSQYMNGMSSSRTLLCFGLPSSPSHVIIEVRKFCVQIVYVVIGPPSEGFHSIKWGSTFRWAILGWSVFGKSIKWICTLWQLAQVRMLVVVFSMWLSKHEVATFAVVSEPSSIISPAGKRRDFFLSLPLLGLRSDVKQTGYLHSLALPSLSLSPFPWGLRWSPQPLYFCLERDSEISPVPRHWGRKVDLCSPWTRGVVYIFALKYLNF